MMIVYRTPTKYNQLNETFNRKPCKILKSIDHSYTRDNHVDYLPTIFWYRYSSIYLVTTNIYLYIYKYILNIVYNYGSYKTQQENNNKFIMGIYCWLGSYFI